MYFLPVRTQYDTYSTSSYEIHEVHTVYDGAYHTPVGQFYHIPLWRFYHTPLWRFSKVDCSTTKRVPTPNDTSSEKLSARCFSRRSWNQHLTIVCLLHIKPFFPLAAHPVSAPILPPREIQALVTKPRHRGTNYWYIVVQYAE